MNNEKIMQVKKLLHDYEDYETKGVYSCDYDELAQEIVKLFAIPAVVERSDPLFCPKCNSTQRIDNDNDAKYTCSRCGTRWAK